MKASKSGGFYIGISGWTYKPWRENFYPAGLAAKKELDYASRKLNSIEINTTFYGLQTPKAFASWYDTVPEGFKFSVKASRYMTHIKRLKDFEAGIANFLASGLFNLKEKMGPILWQFPPNFKFDRERIEPFFKQLPHDTGAAAKLAKKATLDKDRALVKPDTIRALNHVMEIRHESFRCQEFIDLLRQYNVALVFADTPKWPYMEDVTGDVIYARLHGSEDLYVSGYSEEQLDQWAPRFRLWAEGREPNDSKRIGDSPAAKKPRDVFVYFDNDVKIHAPFNAQSLAGRLNAK